jgi:hypothetical protein
VLDAPCSRVGHIYRCKHFPDFSSGESSDFVWRNYKRVAEVWMDEYKEHLYERRPLLQTIDAGNIYLVVRKYANFDNIIATIDLKIEPFLIAYFASTYFRDTLFIETS